MKIEFLLFLQISLPNSLRICLQNKPKLQVFPISEPLFEAVRVVNTLQRFFFLRPYGSTTGEKSPAQGFLTRKNQSLQHRGKSPVQGFSMKTQSLQYRDRVSHTEEL